MKEIWIMELYKYIISVWSNLDECYFILHTKGDEKDMN